MDQITKLLEQLAIKLGTTVEYLWGVLIKQAIIAGITNLILYIILAVGIVIELHYYKYFRNNVADLSYDAEQAYKAGLIVYAIILGVFLIMAVCSLQNTMAAFFNPEYWALQEILSSFGK